MDREEIERDEPEPEIGEQEPHLTLLHAIGLVILLITLQSLIQLLLSKYGSPGLKETMWLNIALTNGISGIFTIEAGAILAGLSVAAMLTTTTFNTLLLVPLAVCVVGISILASEFANLLQWIEPISPQYMDIVNKLNQQNVFGLFFAVAIVAPLTEEAIFRGVIFDGLRRRYRPSTAVLFSASLFALIHALPWLVVNAFLLGLFLAWLKLRTESLVPCLFAHAMYNSLPFFLIRIYPIKITGYTTMPTDKIQFQPLWFDLLGFVLLAVGIAGVRHLCAAKTESIDRV